MSAQDPGSLGAWPTRSPSLQRGQELGSFRLEEKLGEGGMGVVWKAYDRKGERHVAIKFLPLDLAASPDEVARVKQTFQTVHDLTHQHICPVYLLDEASCGPYLVMKYLDAGTLGAYLRAHGGTLPLAEVVRLLRPVAEALDYAHSLKIVHRDVKPQNILVGRDGRQVWVVDFGLAAQIRTSMTRVSRVQMDTAGTYPYMAPEQWRGQYQEGRTDQYQLAVVAYELLTGRLPFEAPDSFMLRECILREPAQAIAEQVASVNAALAKALAKERTERFGSCADFVKALETRAVLRASGPTTELPSTLTLDLGGGVKLELVRIEAGEFWMGAADGEKEARDNEKPQHQVKITRPFYLGKYTVTQEQYGKLIGKNPSHFAASGKGKEAVGGLDTSRFPVEQVSWEDADACCQKLTDQCLKQVPASLRQQGYQFRLPTEAQWEYACRAGTVTPYSFREALNGKQANCAGNYPYGTEKKGPFLGRTTKVGSYDPNRWGLYDMHGNVWQWCQDYYDDKFYDNRVIEDPVNSNKNALKRRVLRGGSWFSGAWGCRAAYRFVFDASARDDDVGFRVALRQD